MSPETSNTYMKTEHSSWYKRLNESCQGAVFGILIGIIGMIGIGLLTWNEGNSVRQQKVYDEGIRIAVRGIGLLIWYEGNSVRQQKVYDEGIRIVVRVNKMNIDNGNDNKLVHISGMIRSGGIGHEPTIDKDFGISVHSAVKLKRITEMYQWVEHIHAEGHKGMFRSATTTKVYTYSKEWQPNVVASTFYHDSDKYKNPTAIMYPSKEVLAPSLHLGEYYVSYSVIVDQCNWFVPFDEIQSNSIDNIPDPNLRSRAQLYSYSGHPSFYLGKDPLNPQIGDMRIRYMIVKDQMISIVARQVAESFATYVSPTNSGTIILVEQGIHDPYEIFLHAQEQLTILTWKLRLVGTILFFTMFQSVTMPLVVVADFIPLMGNCLQMGITFMSAALAFIVSIIIIAIITNRPIVSRILSVVSLFLFGVVGGVAYMLLKHRSNSRIRSMDEHDTMYNDSLTGNYFSSNATFRNRQYERMPMVPEYERSIYKGSCNDCDSTRVKSVHKDDNYVTPTAPFED